MDRPTKLKGEKQKQRRDKIVLKPTVFPLTAKQKFFHQEKEGERNQRDRRILGMLTSLQRSPLSLQSLKNVINAYKEY